MARHRNNTVRVKRDTPKRVTLLTGGNLLERYKRVSRRALSAK